MICGRADPEVVCGRVDPDVFCGNVDSEVVLSVTSVVCPPRLRLTGVRVFPLMDLPLSPSGMWPSRSTP
eukprot:3339318-Prorocentrum_lima.AAC.1